MSSQKHFSGSPIEIVGAGPAGLVAALSIVKQGGRAIVYERHKDVGSRFHDDLQGLENWTTEGDVLEELASIGIETNFTATPFHEAVLFDPAGGEHVYRSTKPMAYIVRRGAIAGSLDMGLKQQALDAGVEIRFAQARDHLANGGIVGGGPHGADAIGVGYLFATEMADGAYIALSNKLAPQGYAYLLIQGGRGTLMSWMYDDFHNEQRYLENSVEFFRRKLGLEMQQPRRTGGAANFSYPRSAHKGNLLYVGEAAGFQDALWGFGMRYAMLSGHLAARALITGQDYDQLWQQRLGGLLRATLVNRYVYCRLGDRGYGRLLRSIDQALRIRQDGRDWLHGYTASRWWKRLCFPFVQRALPSRRPLRVVPVEGCDCTWCRCRSVSATNT